MTTAQKTDAIASICDDFREIIRDIGQHIAQGQQSEAQMASMRPGYGTGVYTHIGHQMRKMLALVTTLSDAQSALESERQAHAAEVERLREDAERYRWLRHGDNDEKVLMVYDTTASRPFDSRYDAAWLPRKEHLDAAIDQAIARGTK